MPTAYLLLEDGGRLRLEDGSGAVLLESSGAAPAESGTPAAAWGVIAGLRRWAARAGGRLWPVKPGVRAWKARAGPMADLQSDPITKAAGDLVWLEADFGDLPELNAADPETIDDCDFPAVSGLTIEGTELVGTYRVGAWFSGGTAGTTYTVVCEVTLSSGAEISRALPLKVE